MFKRDSSSSSSTRKTEAEEKEKEGEEEEEEDGRNETRVGSKDHGKSRSHDQFGGR